MPKAPFKLGGKKMSKWVKKWRVEGSNGNEYVVAQGKVGEFGCSCPAWIFRRIECRHIKYIKKNNPRANMIETIPIKKPEVGYYNIEHPEYDKEKNIIKCPLIRIEPFDLSLEVEIDVMMIENGYSLSEVREIRHLPREWTKRAIYSHYERFIQGRKGEKNRHNL